MDAGWLRSSAAGAIRASVVDLLPCGGDSGGSGKGGEKEGLRLLNEAGRGVARVARAVRREVLLSARSAEWPEVGIDSELGST